MKKFLIATAICALTAGTAGAEDVKLGVVLGFTGPAETLAPGMASGAEMAIKEVSDSGNLMGGMSVSAVRADSTCVDAAAATAAAERLITSDGVDGIMGALCSGATIAILQNVALPNGTVMISPSATSPALTTMEDNNQFFRTAPSDARQGQIVTDILMDRGIKEVALTFSNTDYGKGLADSIQSNFEAAGGTITISVPHEDGKPDYSAEVATLASAGGEILVVAGYLDQGGRGVIQASLDSGAFDTFYLPDGMIGESLPAAIGPDLDGSFGSVPGTDSEGAATFASMAEAAGFEASPFSSESYDAAALILLAMQAAGSKDPAVYKEKIEMVANAPGTQIFPGELAKGLELLAAGEDIDYVGASAVEMVNGGESAGNYREIEVQGGENTTVKFR